MRSYVNEKYINGGGAGKSQNNEAFPPFMKQSRVNSAVAFEFVLPTV